MSTRMSNAREGKEKSDLQDIGVQLPLLRIIPFNRVVEKQSCDELVSNLKMAYLRD